MMMMIFTLFYTANSGKAMYRKVVCCGPSPSFKVIDIGTNRKPVYDFLLVFRCSYMPTFYPLRDITIYLSKICVFSPFFPP